VLFFLVLPKGPEITFGNTSQFDQKSMATELTSLLADLDNGPPESVLTKLQNAIVTERGSLLEKCLGFAEEYKFKAQELGSHIADYEGILPKIRHGLITQTVSQWIFATNKIESTGLSTEGETLKFLQEKMAPNSREEREVQYTYELLKTSYDPNRKLSAGILDVSKLLQWHRVLATGEDSGSVVLPEPGKFRKAGASAHAILELNEPLHLYPHHTAVPILVDQLGAVLYELGKLIEQRYQEGYQVILYRFALAAFAQFHFVDIHPFVDGNGRLCRFISKYVLDGVCPVPFPMFPPSMRTEYLRCLIGGRRSENPRDAPAQLMGLLLECATTHFSQLVKDYGSRRHDIFVCGTKIEHVQEQLQAKGLVLTESSMQEIATAFSADTHKDITVGDLVVRVKRMAEFIPLDAL